MMKKLKYCISTFIGLWVCSLLAHASDISADYTLKKHEEPPYDRKGHEEYAARRSKIKTSSKQIVIQSEDPKENIQLVFTETIDGVKLNPSGTKMLVYFGTGNYEVVDIKSKQKIRLPEKPNIKNTFAYGNWKWLGDNRLIGESGDIKTKDGKPVTDDDNIEKSRLFIFDLSSGTLSEAVVEDNELDAFSLDQVQGNLIKLVPARPKSADKGGWYLMEKRSK